jgi:hypothetical protein
MQGRRRLSMAAKISNRTGAFVGFEGVMGIAEILFAPFVSNRKAARATDFDDFKQSAVREAEAEAKAVHGKSEWKKVMGACEAP